MTISTPKRLGALVLAGAFAFAACAGSGSSTAPSSAPTDAMSNEPSMEASGSPAEGMAAPMPPTAALTLQGAGATFPAPLYESWFQAYTDLYSNIQFDYQSNGSGGGHQGHHPADRRFRRIGRGDEGRGDRCPAERHDAPPLSRPPWAPS